jgi:AraC-like DNA-binding protein
MPITLLQHITKQSFDPNPAEFIKPAAYATELIQGFWILPYKNLDSNCIAFNDGTPTICLFTDSGSHIEVLQNDQIAIIHSAWLSSQYLENIQLRPFCKSGSLLVIRFDPIRFYQVFKIEPKQLREKSIWSLRDAMGDFGNLLLELINKKASAKSKIKAVEMIMADCLSSPNTNYLVELAIKIIKKNKGRTSVAELIKQLKVNYKWLERNFENYLGLSPKEYIALQRFVSAYSCLCENPGYNLLRIAVENGYYDQSHLIKDFKRFVGKTPLSQL